MTREQVFVVGDRVRGPALGENYVRPLPEETDLVASNAMMSVSVREVG